MEACLAAAGSQPAELVKAFDAVDVWLHLLPGPTQYAAVKQLLEQHMDLTVKLVKHELEGSEAQRLQRRVAVTMLNMLGDTAAMPARATSSALASLGQLGSVEADLGRQCPCHCGRSAAHGPAACAAYICGTARLVQGAQNDCPVEAGSAGA